MLYDSVIFDLDGTLWDSTDAVVKSWNAKAHEVGYQITRADIQGIMGLQLPEIGERFFPTLPVEQRMKLMLSCCDYECEVLRQEGGQLYDGIEKMLRELSQKLPLFIVSNCQDGYIQAFLSYHKLSGFIRDYEFSGLKGYSKGENIQFIMKRNNLKNPVYVGDTQGDCDASSFAGIPFIFAKYGFGQVNHYDYCIDTPETLISLMNTAR